MLGLLVLGLTGCIDAESFPDLDREPGPGDVLPDNFASDFGDLADKIDASTVRLAARHDDAGIYVMRTTSGDLCMEIRTDSTGSVFGCGNGSGALRLSSPAGTYEVRPAPLYEEEGWLILSGNVRAKVAASSRADSRTEPEPSAEPTGSGSSLWESTSTSVDDSGHRSGASGDVSAPGTDEMTYVVAEGDTASDIAARFAVGLEQLIDEQGQRLGRYPSIFPGDRIQFGAPLTGDDYDCFFGLDESTVGAGC